MIVAARPTLVVAVISLAVGFAGGYALKWRLADAEIARIETRHAIEREAAARETAARYARAEAAERDAVAALHETRQDLAVAQRRLKDALYSLDPGRCGLSGRARGLLNNAIADAGDVPARAPQSTGADAAVATDTGHATSERDVALWIADAIGKYEECRARIDAIRQWDEVTHGR